MTEIFCKIKKIIFTHFGQKNYEISWAVPEIKVTTKKPFRLNLVRNKNQGFAKFKYFFLVKNSVRKKILRKILAEKRHFPTMPGNYA